MYKHLKFQNEEGVVTVTLNRPEVYNALNDKITFELQDAIKVVSKDSSVRVVVLTGAGKAFCAGQDLKASTESDNRSFSDSLHKRYNPIIKGLRYIVSRYIAYRYIKGWRLSCQGSSSGRHV